MPHAPSPDRALRFCLFGLVTAAIVLQLGSLAAMVFPRRERGGPLASSQLRSGEVRELAPGKILVASRELPDPNFAESVVVLADYNAEGAMGLIVNRQTKAPLARLLPDLLPTQGDVTVFFGGPVTSGGIMALVRAAQSTTDDRPVLEDVFLLTTRDRLVEVIDEDPAPSHVRVYVGYSGWGPGQLDRETAQGAWHVFDGTADVVFDPEPDTVWRRQIRKTDALLAERLAPPAPAH
jgi:putative transcriptional regulator